MNRAYRWENKDGVLRTFDQSERMLGQVPWDALTSSEREYLIKKHDPSMRALSLGTSLYIHITMTVVTLGLWIPCMLVWKAVTHQQRYRNFKQLGIK
jgi:hypothetical protein